MDPRFVDYYHRELIHLAELCGEFAKEHPKIAGRLSLEGFVKEFQCPDPYVERLLEGFAYMAARVQLKLDAEFPRFSQHLLEMVYPDYLAPVPSMGIAQFEFDPSQATLNDGALLPRGTVLRSLLGRNAQTACEYRTAHKVSLWPISITDCRYLPSGAAIAGHGLPDLRAQAGLRLRLRTAAGMPFADLSLDRLALYLRGGDTIAMRLYEHLLANTVGMVVRSASSPDGGSHVVQGSCVKPLGFGDTEALLPWGPRSFEGYRLLREYFLFPERFLFVELTDLSPGVRRCAEGELDIFVLLEKGAALFEGGVDASRFMPFCTPVINLFGKRCDRIHLTETENEYHVVPDRSRPLDFEVYGVSGVTGYGADNTGERAFLPFYACNDRTDVSDAGAYFTTNRRPRVLSTRQKERGPRTSYIGSEVFLSLVDGREAPYRGDLRQLSVTALCTNRDLALDMPVGIGRTDFTLEVSAPVMAVRFIAGPTEPRPAAANREIPWRLISHLSLNYLSLIDEGDREGAVALRQLLELYAVAGAPAMRKQLEGVRSVAARRVHRRLPIPGPVSFGSGLEVLLTLDEGAFEGSGVFLLAAVLEQFFARYVSINAFTEMVLRTPARGEIMRWPARTGRRQIL